MHLAFKIFPKNTNGTLHRRNCHLRGKYFSFRMLNLWFYQGFVGTEFLNHDNCQKTVPKGIISNSYGQNVVFVSYFLNE